MRQKPKWSTSVHSKKTISRNETPELSLKPSSTRFLKIVRCHKSVFGRFDELVTKKKLLKSKQKPMITFSDKKINQFPEKQELQKFSFSIFFSLGHTMNMNACLTFC